MTVVALLSKSSCLKVDKTTLTAVEFIDHIKPRAFGVHRLGVYLDSASARFENFAISCLRPVAMGEDPSESRWHWCG